MSKIKLTKNELKKQKDSLKRFKRFLPTLLLKKQQIQLEILKVRNLAVERAEEEEKLIEDVEQWIAVMGEDAGISDLVKINFIETDIGNIAGVDIPLFKGIKFKEAAYDLYSSPYWFDKAVKEMKSIITLRGEIIILEEQIFLLEEELRITTQRVNLFEKIKIPQSENNIRVIQIFLGDQETAAVVRGKISKSKIIRAAEEIAV
jgi:V/A-type H+/Na+-transporting ATPase subunit D